MSKTGILNTNLASEFLVESWLFRQGYSVKITFGNTKEVDLILRSHQCLML